MDPQEIVDMMFLNHYRPIDEMPSLELARYIIDTLIAKGVRTYNEQMEVVRNIYTRGERVRFRGDIDRVIDLAIDESLRDVDPDIDAAIEAAEASMAPRMSSPPVARNLGPIFAAMRVRNMAASTLFFEAKGYLRDARNALNKLYIDNPEAMLDRQVVRDEIRDILITLRGHIDNVINDLE